MNKTSKILFAVVCLFAFATVGFANATPRTLKECNMLYSTSEDPDKWLPVPGNQVSGFKLTLDESVEWYYLDIKFIKADLPDGVLPVPSSSVYMFWLEPPTDNPAFWAYWAAKGVSDDTPVAFPPWDMADWQYVMWLIIHGDTWGTTIVRAPIFGLYGDGEGNYDLYDGLLRWTGNPGQTLRVNGDYPKGTYEFKCYGEPYVADTVLTGLSFTIEFR